MFFLGEHEVIIKNDGQVLNSCGQSDWVSHRKPKEKIEIYGGKKRKCMRFEGYGLDSV